LHLYVALPPRDLEPGRYERSVVDAALARGVAVEAAGPMWSRRERPAGLVLGYAGLAGKHLTEAARLLGQAL
ncbi:MAG: PLP-dependent aminotransferase family protein, partial [Streptosporangiaceae bacterium]